MRFDVRLRRLVFAFGWLLFAQSLDAYQLDDFSEEERQQIKATGRFHEVLQKAPKRGTAFDRVYTHHLEFGTLDALMESLQKRVQDSPQDGNAWLLLGLFESQRGDDVSAAKSFEQSASILSTNALPSFYRGQSLVRIGSVDEAIASFEQSLARNPPRAERLEVYEQIGRVYQRAQRNTDALAVWKRLESEFPDDLRVLEQIAVTMSEEGDFASAIPRLERLAELVKDDYRRTVFRVQSAKLKIKTNQRESGLKELENVLQTLNPTSWLYRDVRNKIEDVFLAANDQAGLVEYYLRWLKVSPDDIDGMARLAKFLTASGRVQEADTWIEKAIGLAPSRSDLRKAYIAQLLDQKRISNAIEQYRSLASFEPSNPDYLRDWGKLVLRDNSQSIEARNQEAKRIWKELQGLRPDDASHIARVADLLRGAGFHADAKKLFEQAVELAPDDAQYREYLGEFLHIHERSADAIPVWKSMAEGSRRNTPNLSRLADILKRHGLHDLATEMMEEACRLDPTDFRLQLDAAKYLARVERIDAAFDYTTAANKLASTDEERELAMQQRIDLLQSSGQLDKEIVQLATEIRKEKEVSSERWHILAKYCIADNQLPLARESIENALRLDEKSISFLSTASKIAEVSGDFHRAIELCRRLASLDRRSISEHLTKIAKYELQLNRPDAALKAAQELIVSAPGNTDHYEFFAQVSFRIGKTEEGLNALRKAVRINPNEPHLTLVLATALAENGKSDEAIELYWRGFVRAEKLEDQTFLIEKLTPLYKDYHRFSSLVDRLSIMRRDEDKKRSMTICIAQAYTIAKDWLAAQRELESLLTDDTRDTALLQQLANLCQESKDMQNAVKYQRRLVSIAPGAETELPLAKMLQEVGNPEEANSITLNLALREEDPRQRLRTIDSLFAQSSFSSVLQITKPLLLKESENWELLYREGAALALQNNTGDSVLRFQQLLNLKSPHDSPGVIAKERMTNNRSKKKTLGLPRPTESADEQSPFETLKLANRILSVVQADDGQMQTLPPSIRQQRLWMPDSFGQARMAAFAWLSKLDSDDALMNQIYEIRSHASLSGSAHSKESLYDFLYIATLRGKDSELFDVSRTLAKQGGLQEKEYFLSMIQKRSAGTQGQSQSPLDESDLQLMVECFDSLPSHKRISGMTIGSSINNSFANPFLSFPSGMFSASSQFFQQQLKLRQLMMQQQLMQQQMMMQQQMARAISSPVPNQIFTYPVSGVSGTVSFSSSNMYLPNGLATRSIFQTVLAELQLAGKETAASSLIDRLAGSISDLREFNSLMMNCYNSKQFNKLSEYYPTWVEIAKQDIKKNGVNVVAGKGAGASGVPTGPFEESTVLLSQWIGALAPEHKPDQILRVLDPVLDLTILRSKALQTQRSILNRQRSTSSRSLGPQQMVSAISYGSETFLVSMDFPPPNDYVDTSASLLLRHVHEVFQRNEETDLLEMHLRKRLDTVDESNRAIEQLFLSCALWWKNEPAEATELMLASSKQFNADTLFQLEIATLLQQQRDFGTAMEIVESTTTSDPDLEQQKQWLTVGLAEQLGDYQRAIEAVQSLSKMQLVPQRYSMLSNYARRFGLTELATSIDKKSQANRPSVSTNPRPSTSVSAVQNAKAVLARPNQLNLYGSSVRSTNGQITMVPTIDPSRKRALDTLQSAGELTKMVAELEADFASFPKTFSKHELLAEIYDHLKQTEKIGELYAEAIASTPNSAKVRGKYAKHLAMRGQFAEAIDLYHPLMRENPEVLGDQILLLIDCFAAEKKLSEIVEFLRAFNLRSVTNPDQQMRLVKRLFATSELVQIAVQKFEQLFELQPMFRVLLLENTIPNPSVPGLDFSRLIRPTIQKALIPTPMQSKTSPWFGLDELLQSRVNGISQQGLFNSVVRVLESNEMKELSDGIREAAAKDPNWLSGQALPALLDLRTHQKEPAVSIGTLESLLSKKAIEAMPFTVAWNLATALEPIQNAKHLELEVLERTVALAPSPFTASFDENSPVAKYLRVAKQQNQGQRAIAWLRKQAAIQQISQWQPQTYDPIRLECALSLADRMNDLGFPLDALRLYRQLLASPVVIAIASASNTANPRSSVSSSSTMNRIDSRSPKSRCESGIEKAQAILKNLPQDVAISQLMEQIQTSSGRMPLDLSLSNDLLPGLDSQWIKNAELMVQSATHKDATSVSSIWRNLEAQLANRQNEKPDDLSIAIALAWTRLKSSSSETENSLNELLNMIELHPLDELTDEKRPSAIQRKDASRWIALWLVARECLPQQSQKAAGEKLAERAAVAAMRQTDKQWHHGILRERAERFIVLEDRQSAESRLSELLDLVAERPHRKSNRDASFENSVAPLSRQQMLKTLKVAKLGSDWGMKELSRRAVRIACEGGMPPPVESSTMILTNTSSANLSGGASSVSYSYSPYNADPADVTVRVELCNVVSSWRSADHPAADVFLLLRDIVFSNDPRKVINIYSVSLLQNGKQQDHASIAMELVYWANKATKLDELESYMNSWTATMEQSQFQAQANTLRILIQRTKSENSVIK